MRPVPATLIAASLFLAAGSAPIDTNRPLGKVTLRLTAQQGHDLGYVHPVVGDILTLDIRPR